MGSTDVVEVMGLAPWKDAGPWRIYNAKTGVTPEGQPDPDGTLEWGHTVEGWLREWYSRVTGRTYSQCGRIQRSGCDWLWATPDGEWSNSYLEIKNVGSFMAGHWDRANDDGIPDYVRVQVTLGMYCAGVSEWTVVAAIGGLPPRIYHVDYDVELAQMAIEAGRKFWIDHVLAGVPPDVDGSEACREYLRTKWPRDERAMRESTVEEDDIGTERARRSQKAAKYAADVKAMDAKLLTACRDARGIRGDGWQITWKVDKNGVRRSRFTTKGQDDE